ncbi:MAG: hypothetical protein HDS69_03850 [Bacteroidales bacterium]|nr:hypothetical protein [Bacteroidales bacterium]
MESNKTIFFLGAGFSKDAGGPIQNEIIQNILSPDFYERFSDNEDVVKSIDEFKEFLRKELLLSEEKFSKIALEDVFTPIDRCIAQGLSLGSYSAESLMDLREKLHLLMARSIQYGVDFRGHNKNYITKFAHYINSIAKQRITNPELDGIGIITTNWDILLDNSLYDLTKHESQILCEGDTQHGPIAVVDYCCYISSLDNDPFIKPGLLALGRSGYNIKYLKLHGSMNWLHCPLCQRMYVKFGEKTMFETKYCKHCKSNYNLGNKSASIRLRGNLILPTFLKDLSNIQIRIIWQNAGIELSEATKVVFIGYSLPAADFEIRQLLSRFIRKDAKIEVVFHPKAKTEEIERYRIFFGDRQFTEKRMTVGEYVDSLFSGTPLVPK